MIRKPDLSGSNVRASELSNLEALAGALVPLVAAEIAGAQVDPDPLIDAKAAGALLGVPESWVRAEARAGRIPHHRLGKYVRFDRSALLAWRDERATGYRLVTPSPRSVANAGCTALASGEGTDGGTGCR